MRFKKYIFCAMLVALLLLQSCGVIIINDKNTDTATDGTTQTTNGSSTAPEDSPRPTADELEKAAMTKLDKIPSISFENEKVKIFTADDTFFYGDKEETVLNTDRIKRVKLLEKKFTLSVSTVITDKASAIKKISAASKTGTSAGHIYALPADITAALFADGHLKSLRESPYFNENDTCFNSSVEAFTVGHNVFAVSGDGCFEPDKIYALYYNKTKLDALGLPSIGDLVDKGEWTFDKYAEYVSSVEASGYEGGISKTSANIKLDEMLLLSSGFKFANNTPDRTIRLNSFNEQFESLITSAKKVIDTCAPENGTFEDFISGNTLFLTDAISNTEKYAKMSDRWSIAPHPKYSADAEYASFISSDAILLSMPESTENTEGIGALITAINTAAEGHVITRFIEQNMYYTVRDNDALTALGIVTENTSYDFAYIFSSSFKGLNEYTVGAYKKLLSNEMTYTEYVNKYKQDCEEYLDKLASVKYY